MPDELACTLGEMKYRTKEFFELAPLCTSIEELDQIFKMISMSYLNLDYVSENDRYQAAILLRLCFDAFLKAEYKFL